MTSLLKQIFSRRLSLTVFFLAISAFPSLCLQARASTIYYVKAVGIINPVMGEFLVKSIGRASDERAEAIIIELDTPGGLDLSMRDIVKAELASDSPVVVYVAPSGSRAASAGVFITYAATVAAMAPGTNIGSAHPVSMGGEKMDETMLKKVENDAAAYITSIAAKRKRNPDWARDAVVKSDNITAQEAVRLKVIDFMAESRDDLIGKLDGRKVEVATGERTIMARGADVREVEMNLRFRVLNAISNPNVAYILMMIGLVGLYFELSNPGAVLPGVVGAVSLVLAFYALQTLTVNYAGLLLIGLAAIFFILEVKVTSYGLLAVAGVVSLVLGSLMIFDSPLPFMRLSMWVVLPTVVIVTVVILTAMYYAVRIHKKRPVSGAEGLVGESGAAAEDLTPGVPGKVFIEGEYWEAVADGPVKSGGRVRVTGLDGLTLKVTGI